MADNMRWFKVWTSILNEPAFADLPCSAVGRWVMLGAWIAQHGQNGTIRASETAIRRVLKIPPNVDILEALEPLPNVIISYPKKPQKTPAGKFTKKNLTDTSHGGKNGLKDNGIIALSLKRWFKYQVDSTGYARLKRYRKRANDNGLRREEKRREDTTPKSPFSEPKKTRAHTPFKPEKIIPEKPLTKKEMEEQKKALREIFQEKKP
jgi:hypothetical protein